MFNSSIDIASSDTGNIVSIKVIGVGGGGGNAVNRMCEANMKSAEFISVNTDKQALNHSSATYKLHIGDKLTKGLGAGGKPEKGEKSAEENREEIAALLKGTDMLFITAGMGGGTGTGAAPVVGEIARELGILTIGVVTKPFDFEGKVRMRQAEQGIEKLHQSVDALLVIPNERLSQVYDEPITLANAFAMADNVLLQAVQSIAGLIDDYGLVNLDFADVESVMKESGFAHMGVGKATGENMAEKATQMAITSPLLETSLTGARGVMIHFVASQNIPLPDITNASSLVHNAAHEDVNLIWGVSFNEALEDEIHITVIATNFEPESGDLSHMVGQPIHASGTIPPVNNNYVPQQPNMQQPMHQPQQQQQYVQPQHNGGYVPQQHLQVEEQSILDTINSFENPSDDDMNFDDILRSLDKR